MDEENDAEMRVYMNNENIEIFIQPCFILLPDKIHPPINFNRIATPSILFLIAVHYKFLIIKEPSFNYTDWKAISLFYNDPQFILTHALTKLTLLLSLCYCECLLFNFLLFIKIKIYKYNKKGN